MDCLFVERLKVLKGWTYWKVHWCLERFLEKKSYLNWSNFHKTLKKRDFSKNHLWKLHKTEYNRRTFHRKNGSHCMCFFTKSDNDSKYVYVDKQVRCHAKNTQTNNAPRIPREYFTKNLFGKNFYCFMCYFWCFFVSTFLNTFVPYCWLFSWAAIVHKKCVCIYKKERKTFTQRLIKKKMLVTFLPIAFGFRPKQNCLRIISHNFLISLTAGNDKNYEIYVMPVMLFYFWIVIFFCPQDILAMLWGWT